MLHQCGAALDPVAVIIILDAVDLATTSSKREMKDTAFFTLCFAILLSDQ